MNGARNGACPASRLAGLSMPAAGEGIIILVQILDGPLPVVLAILP